MCQGLSDGDTGPSSGRESRDLWEEYPPPWAVLVQEKAGLEAISALGWSVDGTSRCSPSSSFRAQQSWTECEPGHKVLQAL